jgi:glycosyltransferase involved in cell wall biosynthesis
VSVVVPLYNEEDEVTQLIAAISSQLRPDDELLAIDDASSDRTLDELKSMEVRVPQLTVVSLPTNRGASAARNAGVARASHELIVCTDAGNEIPAEWLSAMRGALCDAPQPDLVAGCFRVSTRTAWERAMAVSLYPDVEDVRQPGLLVRLYSRIFGRSFSASRPIGRSLAFRRAAWHRVGGFREDLRAAEDTAFGLAIDREGRCSVQSDGAVVWRQHRSLLATARMFASYGRGDGLQGERVVIIRNTVRATSAVAAPVLLLIGNRVLRRLVLVAAGAYVSFPFWKLRHQPAPFRTAALVPIALATKDLAKAYGCLRGLLERSGKRAQSL